MVGALVINGGVSLRPMNTLLDGVHANIESGICRRRYQGHYLESVFF